MTQEEREYRDQQITDFRYRLVAEMANPYLSAAERRALVQQKASVEHEVPFLGRRKYTAGCIANWLAIYRKHGKAGLAPRARRDAGRPRSLSETEGALLLSHLESHPEMTATAVLRKLQADGRIASSPSSSALSRLVRSAGLQRAKRLHQAHGEQNLKFEFFAPLECVQADCMHAMKLPDAKGRRRSAILLAFIDDATRRVVYASFGFSESSVTFETGIRHILAAHGRVGKLYCDNGATFVSNQTRRILDSLGLVLVHSRPRKPAGRGKVERFFRTVRQQFLAPLDADTLESVEDLNARFHTWLESEYHRSPHRGLNGITPLDAWLAKSRHIVPIDPTVDLEQVFRHQTSRKVYRDSTLTVDGVLFEVASTLIGERVTLRYDPRLEPQRRRLFVFHADQLVAEARLVDSYANAKVRRGEIQLEQTDDLDQNPDAEADGAATPAGPPDTPAGPTNASLAASRVDMTPPDQADHTQEATS